MADQNKETLTAVLCEDRWQIDSERRSYISFHPDGSGEVSKQAGTYVLSAWSYTNKNKIVTNIHARLSYAAIYPYLSARSWNGKL